MNKIKLTREQKRALEAYKRRNENLETFIEQKDSWSNTYQSLKEFTLDEMARLLYQEGSYEFKEEFKVGDWVKASWRYEKPTIHKLIHICGYEVEIDGEQNNTTPGISIISLATPEEIAEEKERRWWNSNGRDVGELKKGDVIRDTTNGIYTEMVKDTKVKTTPPFYKIVCFVEERKDL